MKVSYVDFNWSRFHRWLMREKAIEFEPEIKSTWREKWCLKWWRLQKRWRRKHSERNNENDSTVTIAWIARKKDVQLEKKGPNTEQASFAQAKPIAKQSPFKRSWAKFFWRWTNSLWLSRHSANQLPTLLCQTPLLLIALKFSASDAILNGMKARIND